MYGQAVIDADVTLTGIAAFNFVTGASLIKSLKFFVEEDEMLVDLKVLATLHHSVVGGLIDYTLAHAEGTAALADLAPLAAGIGHLSMPTIANSPTTLTFERTLRLNKGEHVVQLHLQTAAGNIIVDGATWHGYLVAERRSHPATLAHGVDSKTQGIF